jgi:phage anti-repressor protein
MAIDKIAKIAKKYECIKCNYITSNKYDYDKHLLTAKHYRLTNTNENSRKIAKVYICDCGKEYKHASSLFKHRKKCTYTTEEEPENTIVLTPEESNIDYKAMFVEMMKENRELHQTVKEMVPLIGSNNTITNNTRR